MRETLQSPLTWTLNYCAIIHR